MSNIDSQRGLYKKFVVRRTDGRDADGKKHACCEYFVLDLDHDPHAMPALKAYARSCRRTFPKLANDLLRKVAVLTGPFFGGPHVKARRTR